MVALAPIAAAITSVLINISFFINKQPQSSPVALDGPFLLSSTVEIKTISPKKE
jgi:hypothetical protein